MTLARITNYVDGNVLTGAQLNNEFDNILNNGPSLINLAIPKTTQVQGLTGSLISNIGSFAAMGYSLRSTLGVCSVSATSSFSVNTQTAGPVANGRDQAGAFASTDVHFYAISTGGASTAAAGICSSVGPPTGPTLPAGYTAWAYLASAKYDIATSAITLSSAVSVRGAKIYTGTPNATVSCAVGSNTSANSLRSYVPSIASEIELGVRCRGVFASTGGSLSLGQVISADATNDTVIYQTVDTITSTATSPAATWSNYLTASLPNLQTTPTVYLSNTVTVGTSAGLIVNVISYTVPNGDVG